jgi:sec-independent protein translocase protein TatA
VFNISPLEFMVIAVIALLVLGPQRLPDMARSVGKGMREFRAALSGEGRDDRD